VIAAAAARAARAARALATAAPLAPGAGTCASTEACREPEDPSIRGGSP
jgi:hypothetical protein